MDPKTLDCITKTCAMVVARNFRLFKRFPSKSKEDLVQDVLIGGVSLHPVPGIRRGRPGRYAGGGVLKAYADTFAPKFNPALSGTREEQEGKQLTGFVKRVAWCRLIDLHKSMCRRARAEEEWRKGEDDDSGIVVTNFGSQSSVPDVLPHPQLLPLAYHAMALTTRLMPLLLHRNAPGPFTAPQLASSLIVAWEGNDNPRSFLRRIENWEEMREALRFRWRMPHSRAIYRFQMRNSKMPELIRELHGRCLRELAAGQSVAAQ